MADLLASLCCSSRDSPPARHSIFFSLAYSHLFFLSVFLILSFLTVGDQDGSLKSVLPSAILFAFLFSIISWATAPLSFGRLGQLPPLTSPYCSDFCCWQKHLLGLEVQCQPTVPSQAIAFQGRELQKPTTHSDPEPLALTLWQEGMDALPLQVIQSHGPLKHFLVFYSLFLINLSILISLLFYYLVCTCMYSYITMLVYLFSLYVVQLWLSFIQSQSFKSNLLSYNLKSCSPFLFSFPNSLFIMCCDLASRVINLY